LVPKQPLKGEGRGNKLGEAGEKAEGGKIGYWEGGLSSPGRGEENCLEKGKWHFWDRGGAMHRRSGETDENDHMEEGMGHQGRKKAESGSVVRLQGRAAEANRLFFRQGGRDRKGGGRGTEEPM